MGAQSKTDKKQNFYESIEFQALVACAVQGDEKALNDLCEKISRNVVLMASYLLGEEEGAEDIAQDTLFDLCRSIHNLREPQAFQKWLHTILLAKKNKFVADKMKRGAVLDINDYIADLQEDRADLIPDASFENSELRKVVKDLILLLPERQREAIIFRYYNDMSQREVAKAMGVNFPCVSQYLSMARKKIKRGIEEYMLSTDSTIKLNSAMPIGALLTMALNMEAEYLGVVYAEAIKNMLIRCDEYIAASAALIAGGAAAAAEALAASATASGATAVTAEAAGAASVVSKAAYGSVAAIACTLVCGVLLTAGLYIWIDGAASEPAEIPPIPIALVGGERAEEGMIVTNPQNAFINAAETEVLYWWIVEASSDNTVLRGEGLTVAEGFRELSETGERGRHMLYIRSRTGEMLQNTSHVNFYNSPQNIED